MSYAHFPPFFLSLQSSVLTQLIISHVSAKSTIKGKQNISWPFCFGMNNNGCHSLFFQVNLRVMDGLSIYHLFVRKGTNGEME